VDLLYWRSQTYPQNTAYIFLKNGELDPVSLTYQQLWQQAGAIAHHLQSLSPDNLLGERALLIYNYESGLDFIVAFYGCLLAGVVAVPCHPPRHQQDVPDLQTRLVSAQARFVLMEQSSLVRLKNQLGEFPDQALCWVGTDAIAPQTSPLESQQLLQQSKITPETLAFLQYTSGSTGIPKGVQVTHGCIRSNQRMLEVAFSSDAQTISVGWLPLFHDMGLIGNVLQPLHLGIPSILMSPIAFVQKPFRWLQAISHYQATTSGGPNFAYDLLCRHVTAAQRQTLDLSSWQLAFTGAEPIRPATLDQFVAMYQECGFRPTAFYPCYGMAEATLFISGGVKTELPVIGHFDEAALKENRVVPIMIQEQSRTLVGCGRTWLDGEIVIVDPKTQTRCEGDRVGEIWVAGSGVGRGYWNLLEESDRTFQAFLQDTGEGPFLRTGDLGFLLEGELFITGRLKDLLIFWGFNHYPQHLEQTVEQCHAIFRANGGAAFAISVEGEERLVIAQEVERRARKNLDVEGMAEVIRWAVFQKHFVDVYAIAFLKPGSLPRTSSGKVQRSACKAQFLEGSLAVLGEWRSPPDSSTDVTSLLEKYLNPMTHLKRLLRLVWSNIR
jgi:acyl-CoA synthetase (AMP-forming)/AMP-acid ligase II